jgi:molybdopterin-guanine dinucleotide biosynthesis protein A
MVKEKGLIPLRGKPLILWVMDELSKVVDEILVSVSCSPSAELLEILGPSVIIIKDERPEMGPIEGLYSAFSKAKGDYVAVAPCDSPFIKKEMYDFLFKKAKDKDGAVPVEGNYYEPLHAVYYRKSFLKSLQRVISEGKSKPIDAYRYIELEYVNKSEIVELDPALISFTNINTNKDMKNLRSILKI